MNKALEINDTTVCDIKVVKFFYGTTGRTDYQFQFDWNDQEIVYHPVKTAVSHNLQEIFEHVKWFKSQIQDGFKHSVFDLESIRTSNHTIRTWLVIRRPQVTQ